MNDKALGGFSKLSKEEKIDFLVKSYFAKNAEETRDKIASFWHPDSGQQEVFDQFSENTITNYFLPYGIVPNLLLNGKYYSVPMCIEESSVVAASSRSAKYWAARGGIHTEVVDTKKSGQVHFIWSGDPENLRCFFNKIKTELIDGVKDLIENMERRGGGLLDIELLDRTGEMEGLYQIFATFNTCEAQGANFINSVLEKIAEILKKKVEEDQTFSGKEKELRIVMSILSNYTPDCLVRAHVECKVEDLEDKTLGMGPFAFAQKFKDAVEISKVDVNRAVTHNKGIFNGVDAVVLATGNDYRAIEACGHAYAARFGSYQGLSDLHLKDGVFKFSMELPLALGTVGGLTTLHPMARLSLEMLGNPDVKELMSIVAAIGLMQNFGALCSLVTSGIQKGHMKMHLNNILNHLKATKKEKDWLVKCFDKETVSFSSVRESLETLRR